MFVEATVGACCLVHVIDSVGEVLLFQVDDLEGCE